ncbi:hypothetical protein B0J17DRAFT_153101 [Rhizoctonia solani]|nr:hypothetical protein B0J17DRAFT_153101 [Rhizoctonia solani]
MHHIGPMMQPGLAIVLGQSGDLQVQGSQPAGSSAPHEVITQPFVPLLAISNIMTHVILGVTMILNFSIHPAIPYILPLHRPYGDPDTRSRPDSRDLATTIQDQSHSGEPRLLARSRRSPSYHHHRYFLCLSLLQSVFWVAIIWIIVIPGPTHGHHTHHSYEGLGSTNMVRWARRTGNQPRSRGIERQSHAR